MMSEINSETSGFKILRGYRVPVINMYFWIGLVSEVLLRSIIIADLIVFSGERQYGILELQATSGSSHTDIILQREDLA